MQGWKRWSLPLNLQMAEKQHVQLFVARAIYSISLFVLNGKWLVRDDTVDYLVAKDGRAPAWVSRGSPRAIMTRAATCLVKSPFVYSSIQLYLKQSTHCITRTDSDFTVKRAWLETKTQMQSLLGNEQQSRRKRPPQKSPGSSSLGQLMSVCALLAT